MKKNAQNSKVIETSSNIRISGAAYYLPPAKLPAGEILAAEGAGPKSAEGSDEIISRLGIESVHVSRQEQSSDLARTAAELALEQSKIKAAEIGMIVDFTSRPEDHAVPTWSLANKLQHDLRAQKAFTIGFSAGGSSTLLVALKFTASLLQAEPDIQSALLVAGERAVAGKRVLGSSQPVTICGDGASALIVTRSQSDRQRILGTAVWTEGEMHDVLHIPAGGLVQPSDYGDYRLVLDNRRHDAFFSRHSSDIYNRLTNELLAPFGLDLSRVKCIICPNISREDRRDVAGVLGVNEQLFADGKLRTCGHIHSSDHVINYLSAVSSGSLKPGDYVMFCSHGFGFTWAMTLVQY